MAKTKKAAAKPVETKASPAPDAQSGQEGSTDARAEVKSKKEAVADQFAEADAKGAPEVPDEDLQVQRQVRGF